MTLELNESRVEKGGEKGRLSRHIKRGLAGPKEAQMYTEAKSWNFKGGWNRYLELTIVHNQRSHMSHSPADTKGISLQKCPKGFQGLVQRQQRPSNRTCTSICFPSMELALPSQHAVFPCVSCFQQRGTWHLNGPVEP